MESAHAISHALKLAHEMKRDEIIVVNLSGRGDKDVNLVAEKLKGGRRLSRVSTTFARLKTKEGAVLPELALSDSAQSLTLDQYLQLINEVRMIHEVVAPIPTK